MQGLFVQPTLYIFGRLPSPDTNKQLGDILVWLLLCLLHNMYEHVVLVKYLYPLGEIFGLRGEGT